MRVTIDKHGLAALKAICGCAAPVGKDAHEQLLNVRFGDGRASATDTYVLAHVPLTTLAYGGDVEGDLDEPVLVAAATLKHALWKVGKDDVAHVVIDEHGVGCVMPVKTDFTQPFLGEAAA